MFHQSLRSLAFDPRGGELLSGSWDGTVRRWAVPLLAATHMGHLTSTKQPASAAAGGKKGPKPQPADALVAHGVIVGDGEHALASFVAALAQHRFWGREALEQIPA